MKYTKLSPCFILENLENSCFKNTLGTQPCSEAAILVLADGLTNTNSTNADSFKLNNCIVLDSKNLRAI